MAADGSWESRWRRPTGVPPAFTVVFAVLCLAAGAAGFKSQYLDPREVIAEGRPGTFVLTGCESVGGSRQGPSTRCSGEFRSDDGSLHLAGVHLPESHDAAGMGPGDSFRAHGTGRGRGSGHVVRSDARGTGNLTARAVGWTGLGLLGAMLTGFAVRGRMRPGAGRARLGVALGVGTPAAVVTWLAGLGVGTGFWA
ncbi:hypothetical protein [Streptomyces marincola]|uniref:hypothetical protein n=1 Tax=Streptomyces marincola TaxID=2878388 RepID=UPI001CF22439|nr:hypothetical protein [Streptomyces marincola]UCM89591.1 hypothetical protein LC193_17480 [Streptomyces marincola]